MPVVPFFTKLNAREMQARSCQAKLLFSNSVKAHVPTAEERAETVRLGVVKRLERVARELDLELSRPVLAARRIKDLSAALESLSKLCAPSRSASKRTSDSVKTARPMAD
jgi:hypothetical protein